MTSPRDSQATLVVSAPRDTDPPATIVLPPEYFTAQTETATQAAGSTSPPPPPAAMPTMVAGATPSYSPVGSPSTGAVKSSSKTGLIIAAVAAVLVLGAVGIAAVVIWQSSSKNTNSNTTSSGNSNVTAASKSPDASPTPTPNIVPDASWLEGDWEGEGVESDKTTWTVRLTVTGNDYAVDYLDLGCKGHWNLVEKTATEARLTEIITTVGKCASNGAVTVRKLTETQITVQWTYADTAINTSTAVLTKEVE